MENKKWDSHTFAIAAYQESSYLEECVQSLENQSVKSNIVITTSTPNEWIQKVAQNHGLEVKINQGKTGIGADWNFAVEQAGTPFVTIVHQDDLYDVHYTEEIQKAISQNQDCIMLFTNYQEIRNGEIVKKNINLKIKSILLSPIHLGNSKRWIKKWILSFGNPICCPSVCLNTAKVGKRPYLEDMKSNIDWGTWLELAKMQGAFVYLKKNLTLHRVHLESETTRCIEESKRTEEDYEIFCRIWPKWFAKFLMLFYKHAQDANKVDYGRKS